MVSEEEVRRLYEKACDRYVGYVVTNNGSTPKRLLDEMLDHAMILGNILGIDYHESFNKITDEIRDEHSKQNNPFAKLAEKSARCR